MSDLKEIMNLLSEVLPAVDERLAAVAESGQELTKEAQESAEALELIRRTSEDLQREIEEAVVELAEDSTAWEDEYDGAIKHLAREVGEDAATVGLGPWSLPEEFAQMSVFGGDALAEPVRRAADAWRAHLSEMRAAVATDHDLLEAAAKFLENDADALTRQADAAAHGIAEVGQELTRVLSVGRAEMDEQLQEMEAALGELQEEVVGRLRELSEGLSARLGAAGDRLEIEADEADAKIAEAVREADAEHDALEEATAELQRGAGQAEEQMKSPFERLADALDPVTDAVGQVKEAARNLGLPG